MDWLVDAFNWTIPVAGGGLLMREVLGNVFGLASALGGMARRVWAWPVGILGNLILLTVFLASLFTGADHATLLGQAGRQGRADDARGVADGEGGDLVGAHIDVDVLDRVLLAIVHIDVARGHFRLWIGRHRRLVTHQRTSKRLRR